MEKSILETCQEIIRYRFRDESLLSLALTHASVAPTRGTSNERLEFLGDAILGMVVCHELYERDPDLLEGDMTKIKSMVVSRRTCAAVSEDLGVAEQLFLGKGLGPPGGLPESVLAAVFESIIGAIYLDGGLEPAGRFILEHLRERIDDALEDDHKRNFKSILQQHAQRRLGSAPEYLLLDEKGPDHCKCFEIAVAVGGRYFPSAWGKTKKEAEQESARRAPWELGLMKGAEQPMAEPAEAEPS